MAESNDFSSRPSLLPPDPRAGRRRFGPLVLLVVGLGSVGAAFAYRDRLRPVPIASAPVENSPVLFNVPAFEPPPVASPSTSIPTPTMAAALPTWMSKLDAFAAPLLPAKIARATPDAEGYKLQSIVIGPRGRSCMINGRAYQIGDAVGDGTVRSIDRDRVVLRVHQSEIELRLSTASAGYIRPSASR